MNVTITPGTAVGTVAAPPSKSMAHRLLICAGLCHNQTSVIHGVDLSEDIAATLDCLTALGAQCHIEKNTVTVRGIHAPNAAAATSLPCRESGSTLRFFIPLALLSTPKTILTGAKTLLSRPLNVYERLCETQRILFAPTATEVTVQGALSAGTFEIPGNISSQFVTGLLFALPLLEQPSTLRLLPPVESRSYIDLTLAALQQFGITVEWQDTYTLHIPGGQQYTATTLTVEGDYSNAAFFEALNTIGGRVTVTGLNERSLQGDRVYRELFARLQQGYATVDLADCPDLGPVLFAVAAGNHGAVFTNTRRLQLKESNRAHTMAEELSKFGAHVTVEENTVTVLPGKFHAPTEPLCGHNDHRIVMSLAVLLTQTGGTISGAEAVRKSYPGFFNALQQLGTEVQIDNAP